MSDSSSNKNKSWWTESFHIEKVDPETLERRRLFKLNAWKGIVILGVCGVLIFTFFYLMIGLTPLRRILPGDYSQLEVPELIKLRERSEEHTSELQSRGHLVCRLLLEKKNY